MQENDVTADRKGESNQALAFDSPHSSDERTWAALAHASTLLNAATGMGGLIAAAAIWLTQKEKSAWVAFHGLQSLIFQAVQYLIVSLVVGTVWVVGFALSFITLGLGAIVAVPVMIVVMFLGIALMTCGLVYALYGAYQVYEGREFRYVWIGDWVQQRSFETPKTEPHDPRREMESAPTSQ
jgi:uncharacterized Tic20 family protein